MKLLIDNNLSPALARCLQPLFPEHKIVSLRDRFAENTSDVEWITKLSDEGGWAALTRDLRIRTRPHERQAMDASRVVYFFLGSGWKRYDVPETAARLIRLVPAIATQVSLIERGRFFLPINAGSKLRPYQD